MPQQKGNIPALRFPEFNGEWEGTALGMAAKFSKGKGISKDDIDPNGTLHCIRYGELYTDYDTLIDKPISKTSVSEKDLVLSEGGEVIIPASGEDAKDIATAAVVLREGVALGGDLNIIKSDIDGAFLASYLSGKKRLSLASMAQGNSVVHLYAAQLGALRLHLPKETKEQKKIAAFLGAVDEKIAQLQKKKDLLEDYKKGCMQKLFSQQIRFTDDNGNPFPDWAEKKLGDITTSFSGGTPTSTNKEYYLGDIPFIGSGNIKSDKAEQFITKEAFNNSSAKVINKGDLLYALYGATSGEVAISKLSGAINQAVLCIRFHENTSYLYQWLQFNKKKIINTYLQGGQGNLSGQIIKNLKVWLPYGAEQKKIADFLSAIDDKIILVSDELEKARTFKKGLLQHMFV